MIGIDVFASAVVDSRVEITLHTPRTPDDDTISILIGSERLTLEFFDAESLERLRDVAAEGASRLRALSAVHNR